MGTFQTKTLNTTLNANLADLPILKHFKQNEIVTKVDNFRKSEKNILWFLQLATVLGVGYLTWVYVLPPVFTMLGQWIALAATGIFLVGLLLAAPAIYKLLRRLARAIDRVAIRYAPFEELAEQRQKMVANESTFRVAKSGIKQLEQEMEIESANSEKEAEAGQTRILTLQGKAEKLKSDMEAMVKEKGVEAKSDDNYVNKAAEFQKTLAEAQRVNNKTNQAKLFVQKYGDAHRAVYNEIKELLLKS